MLDEQAIRARFRELCTLEPKAAIDELCNVLDGSEEPFQWFAVYMHKLELEQRGNAPYGMGFEKHVTFMVGKASDRSPRLRREQPELEDEAQRLIEAQQQRTITEDELYAFVTRFTAEELSIVGF